MKLNIPDKCHAEQDLLAVGVWHLLSIGSDSIKIMKGLRMEENRPSEILKHYFRYAVISAAKYGNVKSQIYEYAATAFAAVVPIVDMVAEDDVDAVRLFNDTLKFACEKAGPKYGLADGCGEVLFDDIADERLVGALNSLEDTKRQIIVLRDIEKFSHKKLAKLYSCHVVEMQLLVEYIREDLGELYAEIWPFANKDDVKGISEMLVAIGEEIEKKMARLGSDV